MACGPCSRCGYKNDCQESVCALCGSHLDEDSAAHREDAPPMSRVLEGR